MTARPPQVRIAIALATYNGAAFLRPMLDSLTAQTLPPWKVVVVDDGSQDSTLDILNCYQERLPLEIHARALNAGHRATFNEALQLCRDADLVALADQDDIWLPEKLETLAGALGEADLVHSDARTIHADGSPRDASWHATMRLPATQRTESYLVGLNNVTGCTALFRASLLAHALPIPAGVPVHDWWIALQASLGRGIVFVNCPLVLYRLHGGNAVGEGKKHTGFAESLLKQKQWYASVLAASLPLDTEQRNLVVRLLALSGARLERFWIPGDLGWVWFHRHLLFPPPTSQARRLLKVFMTILGVRAARLLGKTG